MTYPEQFDAFWGFCVQLHGQHVTKATAYGKDAVGRFGLYGVVVRMNDKMERLINLTSKPSTITDDESIDDTLRDIAGYAIIALILRSGKWGK